MPRRPYAGDTWVRYENSFRDWITRRKLMPQTWAPVPGYLSDRNGIASSTTHPPSSRDVRHCHTVFHSRFDSRSSVIVWSESAPSGLV